MMRFGLLLIFLVCFSDIVVAGDKLRLNIKSEDPLSLSVMKEGSEKAVIIPRDLILGTEEIYSSVALDDVDGDGVGEVIMTIPVEGGS